jgi:tetratricopeptide (TPR) repeat protein
MRAAAGWVVLCCAIADCAAWGQTFEQARRLHEAGRLADAEAAYRNFLKKHGPDAGALANLGAVLAGQDRFDEAISSYRQALKLAPQLAGIRLNLGIAQFKRGRFEEAVQEFTGFLKAEPEHRQALQLRAISAFELERFEQAAADYQKLLPEGDLTVRLGLASCYARMGRPAEAREVLGPAIGNEESAEVQFLRGQIFVQDNDLDAALTAFEKALQLKPALAKVRFEIGAIHWRKRNAEAAIEAWRAEHEANPRSFEANYALGAALALSAAAREQAEPYLRAALKIKPRHPGASYHLGKLLWTQSKSREAVGLIESAVSGDPESREARYLLATIYQSLGRKADAAREFAEVRRLSEKEVKRGRDLFEANP